MANWLLTKTDIRPQLAIICGSGLGGVGEIVENKQIIPYSQIPEFPKSTSTFILFIRSICSIFCKKYKKILVTLWCSVP